MRTVISNKIRIYNCSIELFWWCKDNLVITNPDWATLMRLGKEDTINRKNVPSELKLYSEYNGGLDLELPFGTLIAIWPFIKDHEYELRFNNNGQVIDQNMKISMPLYDYQEEAVRKLLIAKGGVLQASAGSGKTQIGIDLIKRIGKNALWICGKTDLLNQTISRIHSLYPNIAVGKITDGEVKMVENGITVSTVQTLIHVDGEIYAKKFDTVVVDECFPAGTKISTDKGYKNIENIKIGDKVLSFNHQTKKAEYKKVLNLFVKTSLCLTQVTLSDKILIATNNHPIYTQRGYVAAEDLKYGDYVLCDMRKTSCFGRINKAKTGMGEKDGESVLFSCLSLCDSGSTFNGGKQKICQSKNERKQSNEQFGSTSENDKNEGTEWNIASANKKSRRKWSNCTMPEFIEFETSRNGLSNNNGISCSNSSNKGATKLLSNMLQDRYSDSCSYDCDRGRWRNSSWSENKGKRQKEKRFFVWQRVESVQNYQQSNQEKSKRSYTVYNFEVEDNNNYFANDVLVHNCHACVSAPTKMKMFGKVVGNIAARYKYGLTATPSRSDTMIKAMYAILGCNLHGEFAPVHIIEKEKTNTLTAKHIRVDLDTEFSYDTLDEVGTLDYAALIDFLSTNQKRNQAIVDNVIKVMDKHQKQLVLCSRKEHCETINKMLQDRGVKSVLLMGDVAKGKRKKILTGVTDWNVIVATTSLCKEGLDMPELSCLHWAMVIGDKVATIQSAGRIERVFEGKPEPEIYDYVDMNYPYCIGKWKKRVAFLRKR